MKEPYDENLKRLNEFMDKTFPQVALTFHTVDDMLSEIYKDVYRFRNSVLITSGFILLIVIMGLIGYVNDETQRRSKEIAIRKVNGAEASSTGKFKTYREMPWGEVYLRQFDGRCIKRLAFSYGNRIKDFQAIMEHMHCVPVKHGDIAYQLEIFPDYLVQMILWEGDDEFPPSSQILFSDNFPISFQAEDMAVMGDVIIGSLKSFAKCI